MDELIESLQRLTEVIERQADAIAELIDSQRQAEDLQEPMNYGGDNYGTIRMLDER